MEQQRTKGKGKVTLGEGDSGGQGDKPVSRMSQVERGHLGDGLGRNSCT